MAISDKQVQDALGRLYGILEAGEKGYATAASSAHRRGVKRLYKSYAQQRANHKQEILDEIQRLGGDFNPGSSLPGMIHRGRVAIFATMTIEDDKREKVILKEVALGERYAVKTYQETLALELPAETRQLVERQYEEVRKVVNQVHLLRGEQGQSLVVNLYDSEEDANQSIQALKSAGFPPAAIEKSVLNPAVDFYPNKGTTVTETTLSGAVGGMIWGSLIGVLAALGANQTTLPGVIGPNDDIGIRVLIALGIIALAAVVGGLIGLVIGNGISENDTYEYQQSMQNGRYLVKAVVESARANDAARLLDQIHHRSQETGIGVPT